MKANANVGELEVKSSSTPSANITKETISESSPLEATGSPRVLGCSYSHRHVWCGINPFGLSSFDDDIQIARDNIQATLNTIHVCLTTIHVRLAILNLTKHSGFSTRP